MNTYLANLIQQVEVLNVEEIAGQLVTAARRRFCYLSVLFPGTCGNRI